MNSKNFLRVLLCATEFAFTEFAVAGQYAASFVATEKPATLADGKVEFSYKDDKIAKIKAMIGHGEDITLSGDTLNLAPDAGIIAQGGGSLTITSPVVADGAVKFGVGNLIYDSGLLPSNSYATVFRNVKIDEISIVSTDFSKTRANGISGIGYPYHVKREPGKMTAQLQIYGEYVKAVKLELKQDGDDVVGKVTGAKYFNNKGFSYPLGYDFFDNPRDLQNLPNGRTFTDNNINSVEKFEKYGYGIAQLTATRRYMDYIHDGDFISDQYDTVIAPNTRLEDIEVVYGLLGYNTKLRACYGSVWPRHVKLSDGVLSVQMFSWGVDKYTRCIKLEFRQSGNDVVVRAVYARYIEGNDFDNYDFDTMGKNPVDTNHGLATKENYTETTYAYGMDYLLVRNRREGDIKFTNQLSWAPDVNTNMVVGTNECVTLVTDKSFDFSPNVSGSGTIAFACADNIKGDVTVKLVGTATNTIDSTYIFTGKSPYRILAETGNLYCLPKGRTVIGDHADLYLTKGDWDNGISGGASELHVLTGGRLFQSGINALRCQNQRVYLEGSEFITTYNKKDNRTYANWLALSNGAKISGTYGFNMGYYCANPIMTVSGNGISTIDCPITLVGPPDKASIREILFVVNDTSSSGIDLALNGSIGEMARYPGGCIVKSGIGTMSVNAKITSTTAPIVIRDGELVLGASDITTASTDFKLVNGALTVPTGIANSIGEMEIQSAASLRIENGGSLQIESLIVADDGRLNIELPPGSNALRVASRIDSAQLERVTVNGGIAFQTASGILRERKNGFRVSLQ